MIEKLIPACKAYIWGGKKLKEKYGKITSDDICAESWELSFHPDGLTRLENGEALSLSVNASDLGKNVAKFPPYPL